MRLGRPGDRWGSCSGQSEENGVLWIQEVKTRAAVVCVEMKRYTVLLLLEVLTWTWLTTGFALAITWDQLACGTAFLDPFCQPHYRWVKMSESLLEIRVCQKGWDGRTNIWQIPEWNSLDSHNSLKFLLRIKAQEGNCWVSGIPCPISVMPAALRTTSQFMLRSHQVHLKCPGPHSLPAGNDSWFSFFFLPIWNGI